jgi:hypothetical protein
MLYPPMFARQAGIQIVAPAGKLDGINTQAIHGAMDRRQALAKLLEGTPLVVSSDDGKVVILQLAELPKPVAPLESKPEALNTAVEERALEEVVVSGYVESLVQARAIKRNAVGNEEVIVAEDIAAFPDLNLAESLQRVPGVTINRDSGEGRQITLRGLGPDFTRTQLNGMEVLGNTASGMDNRGGVSRTRMPTAARPPSSTVRPSICRWSICRNTRPTPRCTMKPRPGARASPRRIAVSIWTAPGVTAISAKATRPPTTSTSRRITTLRRI